MSTTIRLTEAIRCSFIRAAMEDVPHVDLKEQIRALVLKDAVDRLPPKVRAVWDDAAIRHFIEMGSVHEGGVTVAVPGVPRYQDEDDKFKLSPAVKIEVEMLEALNDRQEKLRQELRAKLRGVAYAARTRKQLVNMLPEFEKYLPPDEAAADRSVPVVANVVSDFMKAGWPKSKQGVVTQRQRRSTKAAAA